MFSKVTPFREWVWKRDYYTCRLEKYIIIVQHGKLGMGLIHNHATLKAWNGPEDETDWMYIELLQHYPYSSYLSICRQGDVLVVSTVLILYDQDGCVLHRAHQKDIPTYTLVGRESSHGTKELL